MNDYRSHVTMLDQPDKKGKSRYCCVTCGHQFTCSGSRRIIQHIIGRDYCLGYERDILACPNPNLQLKASLLQEYRKKGTKRKVLLPVTSVKLDYNSADNGAWTTNPTFVSSSVASSPLSPSSPLSHSSRTSHSSSAASFSTSTVNEEQTMDITPALAVLLDLDLNEHDFAELDDFLNSKRVKEQNFQDHTLESQSCLFPSRLSSSSSDSHTSSSSFSPSHLQDCPSMLFSTTLTTQHSMTLLDHAILNFFSIYNIPTSAMHDPTFQQFVYAIQSVTDSSYSPFEDMSNKTTSKRERN
jgi:hypothetical protein